MGNIEIQLQLNDVDISKVEVVWQKLKDLQAAEPKVEIISFNFRE